MAYDPYQPPELETVSERRPKWPMTTAGSAACLLVGFAVAMKGLALGLQVAGALNAADAAGLQVFSALDGVSRLSGVGGAIAFLVWQYRVVAKLHHFGVHSLGMSPGKSVAFWFVPFLNIVHGYRVVRAAWAASDPEDAGSPRAWVGKRAAPLVLQWWIVYLLSRPVLQLAGYSLSTFVLGGAILLEAGAAVLMMLVIRGLDARQGEFQRRLTRVLWQREKKAERKARRGELRKELEERAHEGGELAELPESRGALTSTERPELP